LQENQNGFLATSGFSESKNQITVESKYVTPFFAKIAGFLNEEMPHSKFQKFMFP